MNRPKITNRETVIILNHFFPGDVPAIVVIAVRGYFANSYGKRDENDLNVWDDAMIVCEVGKLVKAFNGNTDPSKVNSNLAMLDTGVYRFYRGIHKNRIKAFRAYPEERPRNIWIPTNVRAVLEAALRPGAGYMPTRLTNIRKPPCEPTRKRLSTSSARSRR